MPDLQAISALLSSLKTVSDMTKAIVGIRDGAKLQAIMIELRSAIIEAQQQAIDAQAAQGVLSDRVRELENQMRQRTTKPCPLCGLQMKTIKVEADRTFGDLGVQEHTLQCTCGHSETRMVDPSKL